MSLTFKKIIAIVSACLILSLCLTGCTSSSKKAENETLKLGEKLMQDFLTAYIPGGKVLEAKLHMEHELGFGTKSYSTEYVCGTYEDADGVWKFEANTETGKLYSSKYFERLEMLIGQKILEKLELGEGAEVTRLEHTYTALPHHCEAFGHDSDEFEFFGEPTNTIAKYETLSFYDVLPIAMVDPDGYLAREDRQTLYVYYCEITLPEGVETPELTEEMFPLCWDGLQVDKIVFIMNSAS